MPPVRRDVGRRPSSPEVQCPTCGAEPETKCRRPSGHPVPGGVHDARDLRALSEVDDYWPCPASPDPVPASPSDQREMFA